MSTNHSQTLSLCCTQITLEAMKSPHDDIALQGIEFWSTVCDEEVDLAIEAAEAKDQGRPPEQVSRFYVKGAQQYLLPVLLMTLTKQVRSCDSHVVVYCICWRLHWVAED